MNTPTVYTPEQLRSEPLTNISKGLPDGRWVAAQRKADALHHFERIATAEKPDVLDWRVVTMVGNVMQVLLERGILQDPDGLLRDAFGALRDAARRAGRGANIRLTGDGLRQVRGLLRDWGEVLDQAPHRTMLQAFREVYRRLQSMGGRDCIDQIDRFSL